MQEQVIRNSQPTYSQMRFANAKEAWRAGDWAHGRFSLPAGDDAEFIPAPER